MENHKTTRDKAPPANSTFGSNYGNLAMLWTDSLTYSPPERTVVFDGGVNTWFQQDVKDAAASKVNYIVYRTVTVMDDKGKIWSCSKSLIQSSIS